MCGTSLKLSWAAIPQMGICTFFVLDSYGLLLSSAVAKWWSLAAGVLFNFGMFVGPAIKALLMPLNIVLVAINS
jgi:hypothetical protein